MNKKINHTTLQFNSTGLLNLKPPNTMEMLSIR